MGNKLTTEEFIAKAKLIHGDKYDYSLVEYVNNHSKVKIICCEHGIFEQEPNNHLNGSGCPTCSIIRRVNNRKIGLDCFIKIAANKHNNKYDYSLVEYVNSHTKVKIICPEHGVFEQIPKDHLKGRGCNSCKYVLMGVLLRSNVDEFVKKAKIIHGDKYDYGQTMYFNNHTKVKIICPEHGGFSQTPNDHLDGAGCAKCFESKGERNIRILLEKNNISYTQEKRFDDCKYKYTLPFDFYLPKHNILIEYDGIQHFESIEHFGGENSLLVNQQNDKIKTDYAITNNIKLIRIKYNENIEEKLCELL